MWKHLFFVAALGFMIAYLQTGEWVMLGAGVVMILLHELAHWFCSRSFGYTARLFSIGFGSHPRWVIGRLWGTEFQITPWLLGGYAEIDPGSDEFRKRPAWKRLAVILSGVVLNLALAFVIIFSLFAAAGERTVVPNSVSIQRIVGRISPAADAGMQRGDRIISVDGAPVASYAELHDGMLKHVDGSAANVVVERSGSRLAMTVHPDRRGLLGATLSYRVNALYKHLGVWPAFKRAGSVVFGMVTQLVRGVLMVLHLVPVTAGAPAGSGAAHGLLALVQMGGIAFHQGLYSFANMVAYFSVNLAFFNLLPIPGFDGGHLLYFAWEKLTGKPVRSDWRQLLERVSIIIVVLVMAYALFNDILHPVV